MDLDPDVVAALDDDFDFDDPENQIEDNFIELATGGGQFNLLKIIAFILGIKTAYMIFQSITQPQAKFHKNWSSCFCERVINMYASIYQS